MFALLAVLVMLTLTGCASKSPPEFLQNASASLFGGVITNAQTGAMMQAVPPPKPNGFAIFYGGEQ